jgi:hypothetical protein
MFFSPKESWSPTREDFKKNRKWQKAQFWDDTSLVTGTIFNRLSSPYVFKVGETFHFQDVEPQPFALHAKV